MRQEVWTTNEAVAGPSKTHAKHDQSQRKPKWESP